MNSLQRTIKLKIKDNEYSVNYPKVGQIIKIEALKQELSGGQYSQMISSNLKVQYDAIEMIQVIANFTVLIPDLLKDLNKVSFEDIDAIDFKEVLKAYREQFSPWYNAWYEVFTKQEDDAK